MVSTVSPRECIHQTTLNCNITPNISSILQRLFHGGRTEAARQHAGGDSNFTNMRSFRVTSFSLWRLSDFLYHTLPAFLFMFFGLHYSRGTGSLFSFWFGCLDVPDRPHLPQNTRCSKLMHAKHGQNQRKKCRREWRGGEMSWKQTSLLPH